MWRGNFGSLVPQSPRTKIHICLSKQGRDITLRIHIKGAVIQQVDVTVDSPHHGFTTDMSWHLSPSGNVYLFHNYYCGSNCILHLQLLILEILTVETNNKSDDSNEPLVDDFARGAFGKKKEKNSAYLCCTPKKSNSCFLKLKMK
jgi:hypothetical protein